MKHFDRITISRETNEKDGLRARHYKCEIETKYVDTIVGLLTDHPEYFFMNGKLEPLDDATYIKEPNNA